MPFFLTRGRGLFSRRRRTRGYISRLCSYLETTAPPTLQHSPMRTPWKPEESGDAKQPTQWEPDMFTFSFSSLGGWDAAEPVSSGTFAAKRPRQPSSASTIASSEPIDIPQSPNEDLALGNIGMDRDKGRCIVGSCYPPAWSAPETDEEIDRRPDFLIKWETSFRKNGEEAALRGEPHPCNQMDELTMGDEIATDLNAETIDSMAGGEIFVMDLETGGVW